MVTLKQIAMECRCSVATVSKAINGMPDINEATAKRIRESALAMGYQPNAAARTLKTNRSKTIGLLMFLQNETIWTHNYFGRIAESIQTELEGNGYDIIPIDARHAQQSGSYLSYCQYRNYDGVILMSAGFTESSLMELVRSNLPLVTIDYAVDNLGAVMSDNVGGMRELVQYIHERGHRHIAIIHGEMTSVTHKRLASFFTTCDELGIVIPDECIIPSRYHDPELSAQATIKLLEMNQPPTCILYPDDYAIIGGMNELRQRNIRVPEDISIAGYDGIPLSSVLKPPTTTVKQDAEGIGRQAARMLLKAIVKPRNFIPQHVTLPSKLVPGGTVKDLTVQ